MSGMELFAGLLMAGTLMAPKPPARTDWAGENVFIKNSGTQYGEVDRDGKFTPTGRLLSLQYVVVREDKGYLQINNLGKLVWIKKDDMVRMKDAPEHYTKMLDMEPSEAKWFAFRGWAQFRNGRREESLKDYAEAIRLEPEAPHWYGNRGVIHMEMKKYDDAIADFSSSIDLAPMENSFRNRGSAYAKKKQFEKAIADYKSAVELNEKSSVNLNAYAWMLSTCTEAKVRDGKLAVKYATMACELTEFKNGGYLDTLAAAYAEAGEFDKAVEWQEKALKAGDIPIKDVPSARQRLELFKMKKSYQDTEE